MAELQSRMNQLVVAGNFGVPDIRPFLAVLHRIVHSNGYKDIHLDFSDLTVAFEVGILPIVAVVEKYREKYDCEINLTLPEDRKLSSLFVNTNWAHYLAPSQYPLSEIKSAIHLPAQRYSDSSSQTVAVDNIMNIVLNTIPGLDRNQLQALEWAIQEISDNVLNHSRTEFGGYIQATTFTQRRAVEFVVSDSGVGIPTTLGQTNHQMALEEAIKEGVTRDSGTNAGNGLFGSFEIARLSRGTFSINSYCGALYLTQAGALKTAFERVPYQGTTVTVTISCADPELLLNALTFRGKKHEVGFDYLEKRFDEEADSMTIHMARESRSFGNREFGKTMYNKICNLMASAERKSITFDFENVPVISSSFADEVFGRFFADMGAMAFVSRFKFINSNPTVRALIDRAITQRVATGLSRPTAKS